MREIKFEIKIKHKDSGNTWTDVLSLDDLLSRNGCLYSPSIQELVFKRQFTGLLDKNGKEIFEGDILEYKNEFGKHKLHQVFRKSGGLSINTHDDDFYKNPENICFYDACADMQTSGWITQCEVIGNIHENPELLTPNAKH